MGKGWRYNGQGQPVSGVREKCSCGALLTPSPPWGQTHQPKRPTERQRDLQPLWKSSLPQASSNAPTPSDKEHLSPCPGPPQDRTTSSSSARSSFAALSLCSLSTDWNRTFQHRKHPMTPWPGWSCLPASPALPTPPHPPKTSGKGTLPLHRAASRLAGTHPLWAPAGGLPGGCSDPSGVAATYL